MRVANKQWGFLGLSKSEKLNKTLFLEGFGFRKQGFIILYCNKAIDVLVNQNFPFATNEPQGICSGDTAHYINKTQTFDFRINITSKFNNFQRNTFLSIVWITTHIHSMYTLHTIRVKLRSWSRCATVFT